MKKFFLLLCSLIVYVSLNAQPRVPQQDIQEGFMILLDRYNQELNTEEGAAGSATVLLGTAFSAFRPMLVSKSIFFALIKKSMDRSSFKRLMDEYWVVYDVYNYYLLVPRIKHDALKSYLNYSDFTNVSFDHINKEYENLSVGATKKMLWDIFINSTVVKPFHEVLAEIFVPADETISPVMKWSIAVLGHGMSGKNSLDSARVSDLTVPEMLDLLNFFKSQLDIALLIYHSCYLGGVNKIHAFKGTFPFPIIIIGLSDAPTYMNVKVNIKQMFDRLLAKNVTLEDYPQILKDSQFIEKVSDFPQIRLPGMESFSTEGFSHPKTEEAYQIISRVQSLTQQKEQVISATKKLLCVYASTVPFPVRFEHAPTLKHGNNLAIALMSPVTNTYRFADINAPSLTLEKLLKAFAEIAKETLFHTASTLTA